MLGHSKIRMEGILEPNTQDKVEFVKSGPQVFTCFLDL